MKTTGNEEKMRSENNAPEWRRPTKNPREGWAGASEAIAREGDDTLFLDECPNDNDAELTW
ncbi:transcriptional regulator/antitoxin, MazE [Caballeronia humi]|uniref:Transcriptional regulator/antitoxin, MazE n=2 Tax=Caballeronia humi TaxID=326474 RepID=A0A158HY34_9BURK|nr:transcriptional regulator/antitoxin, MazE [Caballeronia humi]